MLKVYKKCYGSMQLGIKETELSLEQEPGQETVHKLSMGLIRSCHHSCHPPMAILLHTVLCVLLKTVTLGYLIN